MRNPVATPASIILGLLLFGFLVMVVYSYAFAARTAYVLEQYRTAYIWGQAFLLFMDGFFAFQCAGALIAYSLFLGVPAFFEKKALFRYLSSVIVSLLFLTVLFVVGREGLAPLVRKNLRDTRSLGLFSESLFTSAQARAGAGDPVGALENLKYAMLIDAQNQGKIALHSQLLSELTDAQFDEYLTRTTGEDPREEFNLAAALSRARAALEKRDLDRAAAYAASVLAVDPAHAEALRISGIAGEKRYRENAARTAENQHALYRGKMDGLKALTAGKNGSAREAERAYYIFTDLRRRFPLDDHVPAYLDEARRLLPAASFFTDEAELALSFPALAEKNVVFFNRTAPNERELVAVESLVAAGGETYFRNVEVAGFGPDGRLLYHYLAPLGKIIVSAVEKKSAEGKIEGRVNAPFINFNGLDRRDPGRRAAVRTLAGVPPYDREQGLRLFIDPADLRSFTLSQSAIAEKSLGELFSLIPPFKDPSLFSRHARMDELILREIVLRAVQPLFLLILTLACLCIGLTQNARYLSSIPKVIYAWVLVIPLVMLAVMEAVLFLHRMGSVFLFYALGPLAGTLLIAGLHVFFLILALFRFSGRIGSALRR